MRLLSWTFSSSFGDLSGACQTFLQLQRIVGGDTWPLASIGALLGKSGDMLLFCLSMRWRRFSNQEIYTGQKCNISVIYGDFGYMYITFISIYVSAYLHTYIHRHIQYTIYLVYIVHNTYFVIYRIYVCWATLRLIDHQLIRHKYI